MPDLGQSGARVICCGGRDYRNGQVVWRALAALPVGATVVHGAARGADEYVDRFAPRLGIEVERHPADWTRGRRAGPERNERMAKLGAELCLAFPGGRGTEDMMRRAEAHGIPVKKVGW